VAQPPKVVECGRRTGMEDGGVWPLKAVECGQRPGKEEGGTPTPEEAERE
jgi:hypothetical protein